MEKVVATHQFGPHRVDVVEDVDDDGRENFMVLVDDKIITTSPMDLNPTMEDVVRIYAEWQSANS
jgi:hypothetical protein